MDSAELRIFQAVARDGAITKAAARLGYVQSNVTARIKQLETELGTDLFYRHNRGITLTSSGKMLLNYADKIIGLLDEAASALSFTGEPSGPLLIGSTQTTAAVRMPKLLSQYYEKYPKVELMLLTDMSDRLLEKVLQYELDVAFGSFRSTHDELTRLPVFDEEVVVISPPGIESLDEALSKPSLVYNRGCTFREQLEDMKKAHGRTNVTTMEFGTLEAILGGVSAGLGISLLPRMVAEQKAQEGAVRIHEVPEAIRHMKTEIIYRKNSQPTSALRALIELLGAQEKLVS